MSIQTYPNGLGGSLGDSLDTCRPLILSGNAWYVNFATGVDAASPAGQNREKPLKTLARAHTNASDEDIIVFLTGHSETLVTFQDITKRLTLVGEGLVAGKPSVTFYGNAAASTIFNVSASNVQLRGLYFPENKQANSVAKVSVFGARCKIRGCWFDCGANDKGGAVALGLGSNGARFESDTFISTATSTASQPLAAIKSTTDGSIDGVEIADTVVSAGTVGFSNYSAVDLASSVVTSLEISNLSLLLGADMDLGQSVSGRVNVQLATGGSRVTWSF